MRPAAKKYRIPAICSEKTRAAFSNHPAYTALFLFIRSICYAIAPAPSLVSKKQYVPAAGQVSDSSMVIIPADTVAALPGILTPFPVRHAFHC